MLLFERNNAKARETRILQPFHIGLFTLHSVSANYNMECCNTVLYCN
jgi:hypothetical protein